MKKTGVNYLYYSFSLLDHCTVHKKSYKDWDSRFKQKKSDAYT